MRSAVECVWSLQAELGEGPIWLPADRAVWFVDIKKNRIHRYEPESGRKRSYDAPPSPSFIVPGEDGKFVVGLRSGLNRFDPSTADFQLLCEVEPELTGNRLNDGALDGEGRLWFGSMDDGEVQQTGTLYRLDRGEPVPVDPGYHIPNGPCFSPDGRTLYHTDTRANTIFKFDVGDDGSVSNKRVFVVIDDGAGHPDGSVTDAEGHLWTCLFFGWEARRYAPDGRLVATVKFPCSNITKLTFGGGDLRSAYVTTACHALDSRQRAEQPLAGALFCFQTDVPGLPQGVLHV